MSIFFGILVGLGAEDERLHRQLVTRRRYERGQLSRPQLQHIRPELAYRLRRGRSLDRQVEADQPGLPVQVAAAERQTFVVRFTSLGDGLEEPCGPARSIAEDVMANLPPLKS